MVDLPEPDSPVNQSTQGCCPFSLDRAPLVDGERLPLDVGGAPQAELDHARSDRGMGEAVDQDEAAGLGILGVRIEHERLAGA